MIHSNTMNGQERALAQLIVATLNLDFDIETATADTAIYGDGFGLDSIDILEIAMAVFQNYGVKLRSDDERNVEIFKSLRTLSEYIQANKLK